MTWTIFGPNGKFSVPTTFNYIDFSTEFSYSWIQIEVAFCYIHKENLKVLIKQINSGHSHVFLRSLPELVEASDAKVGPTCTSSSSQAMHSSERVQLKVGVGPEALSSSMLWHTELVARLILEMRQGTLSLPPGKSDHDQTDSRFEMGSKGHSVSGRSTESQAGESYCSSSPIDYARGSAKQCW